MNVETAKEIARLTCTTRQMIGAIRLFRVDTSMGLIDAKHYLEEHSKDGEEALVVKLCKDYVQDKRDLLAIALREHRVLTAHILQLMDEIAGEIELVEVS